MKKLLFSIGLLVVPSMTFGSNQATQILDEFESRYKTQVIQDMEKHKHLYSDVFKKSFNLNLEVEQTPLSPNIKFDLEGNIAANIPAKAMEIKLKGKINTGKIKNAPIESINADAQMQLKMIQDKVFMMFDKLSLKGLDPQKKKELEKFTRQWFKFDTSKLEKELKINIWDEIGNPKAVYQSILKRTKTFLENVKLFTPKLQTVRTEGAFYVLDVKIGGDEFADIIKHGEILFSGMLTDISKGSPKNNIKFLTQELKRRAEEMQRDVRNSHIGFEGVLKINKSDRKHWELLGYLGEDREEGFDKKVSVIIQKDGNGCVVEIKPIGDREKNGFLKIDHQFGKHFNVLFQENQDGEGFDFMSQKVGRNWTGKLIIRESMWTPEERTLKTFKILDFSFTPILKDGSGEFNFYKENGKKVGILKLSHWDFAKNGTRARVIGKILVPGFMSKSDTLKELVSFDFGVNYTPLRNLRIKAPSRAIDIKDTEFGKEFMEGFTTGFARNMKRSHRPRPLVAPKYPSEIRNLANNKGEAPSFGMPPMPPKLIKAYPKPFENAFFRDKSDPAMGRGKLVIVEFTSLACPFCKRAHFQNKDYFEELAQAGKITYIIKDNPLSFEGKAVQRAHIATNLVLRDLGDRAYFKFIDKVFEKQDEWKNLSRSDAEVFFTELGESMFDYTIGDWDNAEILLEIQDDLAEAKDHNVNGTPSFFIGDERLVGAMPLNVMKDIIKVKLIR